MNEKNRTPRTERGIYDIAVAGGGFAGSLTAIQLARRGFRVVVLERGKQIGQETRSGGVSSIEWWRLLGETEPPPFLQRLEFCERVLFTPDGAVKRRVAGPELYAFERSELDKYLLGRMEAEGIEIRENFNVEGLVEDPRGFCYVRSAGRNLRARVTVVATGTDEQLLIRCRFIDNRTRRRVRIVCQEHLLWEADTAPATKGDITFFSNVPGITHCTGYLLRINGHAYLVFSGVVDGSSLSDWTFKPREIASWVRNHTELAFRLRGAQLFEWRTRMVGTEPPLRRPLYGSNFLLVGDAALPMGGTPPWGSGFRWAALTAREAATVLTRALPSPTRLRLRAYAERLAPVSRRAAWAVRRTYLENRLAGSLAAFLARLPW